MEDGYDSIDSTYYSTYSSDSDWGEQDATLEKSFLTGLPSDVIELNVWPFLMDCCKRQNDLAQTLCTLRSVCSAWRRWIRNTPEGDMYMEAYSNHLVDLFVQEEIEQIDRASREQ